MEFMSPEELQERERLSSRRGLLDGESKSREDSVDNEKILHIRMTRSRRRRRGDWEQFGSLLQMSLISNLVSRYRVDWTLKSNVPAM